MVIRDGQRLNPQTTVGLGDVRGERQRLSRKLERGREAAAFRERNQALAHRAVVEGRLFVLRRGDHCLAFTGSRGFHRRDDPVTERHQDHEDTKKESLVRGAREPSGVSLSCTCVLLHDVEHDYREVAGGSIQGGQCARFPRASSGLRCLAFILMGIADSSSVCAGQARMGRPGVPGQTTPGYRPALSPYPTAP